MKMTVGMPHYEDFYGVDMTLTSIFADNDWTNKDEIEVLVVDDSPEGSKHTTEVIKLLGKYKESGLNVLYKKRDAAYPSPALTKGEVFDHATGDVVLVTDCHVRFGKDALSKTLGFFQKNNNMNAIVSGPMIHTSGAWYLNHEFIPQEKYHDHMEPIWRGMMFGIWAADTRSTIRSNPPFTVPAQGCGVFACLKKFWVGFNKDFRGFGGEEFYLQRKFAAHNGLVLCLPWLRWLHRFGRPEGVQFPNLIYDRVRNYVIGHHELGLEVNDIYDHFVNLAPELTDDELRLHLIQEHSQDAKDIMRMDRVALDKVHKMMKMNLDEWNYLLDDPINHLSPLHRAKPRSIPGLKVPEGTVTKSSMIEFLSGSVRAIEPHFPEMLKVASKVDSVVEFTKLRESTPIWCSGNAAVTTFTTEPDTLLEMLHSLVGDQLRIRYGVSELDMNSIEETDLLYLDLQKKTGKLLQAVFDKFLPSVKKYVMIRGTAEFGGHAEGSQGKKVQAPGMWIPIKKALDANTLFVVSHRNHYSGMTLFGTSAVERPFYEQHLVPPGYGPGSELKKLLSSIGINSKPNCSCNAFAAKMDRWGVDGCYIRSENIVSKIRQNAKDWGWGSIKDMLKPAHNSDQLTVKEKLTAAWKSIRTGLVFTINPLDPFPGLVQKAINNAITAWENQTKKTFDLGKIVIPEGSSSDWMEF